MQTRAEGWENTKTAGRGITQALESSFNLFESSVGFLVESVLQYFTRATASQLYTSKGDILPRKSYNYHD